MTVEGASLEMKMFKHRSGGSLGHRVRDVGEVTKPNTV